MPPNPLVQTQEYKIPAINLLSDLWLKTKKPPRVSYRSYPDTTELTEIQERFETWTKRTGTEITVKSSKPTVTQSGWYNRTQPSIFVFSLAKLRQTVHRCIARNCFFPLWWLELYGARKLVSKYDYGLCFLPGFRPGGTPWILLSAPADAASSKFTFKSGCRQSADWERDKYFCCRHSCKEMKFRELVFPPDLEKAQKPTITGSCCLTFKAETTIVNFIRHSTPQE